MQLLHCGGRWRELVAAAGMILCVGSVAAAGKPCQLDKVKVSPESQTVPEGGQVSMNGPNGMLTYRWQQTSGPEVSFDPTRDHVVFTAPDVPPAGATLTFRLTVTACDPVESATLGAVVTVTNVNSAPLASISVSPSPIFEGAVVTLDGSASTDPDGDVLFYAWTQIVGAGVTIDNAADALASFTAPGVAPAGVSLTFRLTVNDGALTDSEDVIVNVLNVNQPPEVAVVCPGNVNEGDPVTLLANATDDDQITSYLWTHTDGAPSITSGDWGSASFTFTAPALGLGQDGRLTFRVVVTDTEGLSADATCSVQIDDVTPPVLTLPADITAEATSAAGAVVTFEATGEDAHDGPVDVTCTPTSGSAFPPGQTTAQCSAKDAAENEATGSFNITVQDTTPPALTLPSDVTVEATGPSGAAAEFLVSAEDLVDGAVDVTCDGSSGDTFPLGKTTVTCTATDAAGNVATGSFLVTVQDTTPPDVTVPADMTVEATGPSGAVATFTASASDIVDGVIAATCIPPSGATFPLGANTVTCSATDAAGNKGTATFKVTVVDTTPPVLTLPANLQLEATGPSGAAATFTATASDLVTVNVTVTCSPQSGSTFALGATTVNCSASDSAGNTATGSFTVTVVDTTPPAIATHPDQSFMLGSSTAYTPPTATDVVDGSVPVTCAPAPDAVFPLGATTITCTATDKHSNSSSSQFTIRVLFAQAGLCLAGPGRQVLQPIAFTGTSVFRKTGSTVPVKFRVCDAAGNAYHLANPVTSFQFIGVIEGTAPVDPYTDAVSTAADTAFRWSEADQFWIFNLSTKPYAAGLTYVFRISLIDGSVIDFQFGLK